MNLLHTLVAGCMSYREFLERRDMLVSCTRLYEDLCQMEAFALQARNLHLRKRAGVHPSVHYGLFIVQTSSPDIFLPTAGRSGETAGSHRAFHAEDSLHLVISLVNPDSLTPPFEKLSRNGYLMRCFFGAFT